MNTRLFIISSILSTSLAGVSLSQQNPAWLRFQDGHGFDDVLTDVVTDGGGNVYVAGWTTNDNGNSDYYIARYDAAGTRIWYHLYDHGGDDVAVSIALAGSCVYVTGRSKSGAGFGSHDDIATFILDTAGAIAPTDSNVFRYDHGGWERDDGAYKILVPPPLVPESLFTQNLHKDTSECSVFYVVGTHKDSLSLAGHPVILKYNSSGLLAIGFSAGVGDDQVIGASLVEGGSIYVGMSTRVGGGLSAYSTVKFNDTPGIEWTRMYSNVGRDFALGITADTSGAYITGTSWSVCGDRDVATVKYTPDGDQAWATRAYDCNYTQVGSGAIALDEASVYAGAFHAGGSQYFTYDKSDGTLIWDMGSNLQSLWTSIYPTGDGKVYIAGHRIFNDYPYDGFHLLQFTRLGGLDWETVYDATGGFGSNTLTATSLCSADSSIIMVGSAGEHDDQDMVIMKYRLPGGVSAVEDVDIPVEFHLGQNSPNPFNPSTTISYAVPRPGLVTMKIFDLLGREVATLIGERKEAGRHVVEWKAGDTPSGIYFYRITAGEFTDTKKMVLLK